MKEEAELKCQKREENRTGKFQRRTEYVQWKQSHIKEQKWWRRKT